MEPFKFVRAGDQHQAISLLSGNGAKPIAGGTNLIDLMTLNWLIILP
jgi:CO/xanthine dehydrogenase FAD-binding subunit